jgi:pseudouridine synthase
MGSRRSCEGLIRDGRVAVNGKTAKLGDSADPAVDRVTLDGERLVLERPVYWMLHKPKGVLTTLRDPEGRPTVAQLLPREVGHVFPVGRLDADTEGLLLLTNDGAVAQALLHPSLESEREYDVVVRGELGERAIRRLERGVRLDDGVTSPARVDKVRPDPESGTTRLRLVLHEGRRRQIRRSLLAVGHPVKRLVRVRMGPIRLGRLPRGKARALRSEEVAALRRHCQELAPKPRARSGGRRPRGRSRSARSDR